MARTGPPGALRYLHSIDAENICVRLLCVIDHGIGGWDAREGDGHQTGEVVVDGSDVESEVGDVAVLDDIGFAFEAEGALLPAFRH